MTNVEQRSVALKLTRTEDSVTVTLPEDPSLVPPGWYMLDVLDKDGTPSKAVWVKVPAALPGG
ncbi:galactose oxidase early set domain-containing protein [Streptomyces sp. M19]